MTRWRVTTCLALLLLVQGVPAADAQESPLILRVNALIGLARTARAQGQDLTAVTCLREADRLMPLSGGPLAEYFWAAHRAATSEAEAVGLRVLAATPGQSDVRDAVIGLLVGRDEPRVSELARAGARLEPMRAVWPRRLAESALRASRYHEAADRYREASERGGAEPADRAQWALSLELAGAKREAASAWASLPAALIEARPEWQASQARALAALRPERPAAPVAPPTPEEIVARSIRALAFAPCADEPLERLQALSDPDPFVAAVLARPAPCPGREGWTTRAMDAAIAAGSFDKVLKLGLPLLDVDDEALLVRERCGIVLHWLGRDREAEPLLERVVTAGVVSPRAVRSLVEARRARGDAERAWTLAAEHWTGAGTANERVLLAELAFETGREGIALDLARNLEADDEATRVRARVVEGGALLALGRPADAKSILQPLVPDPRATAAWLDAVAAIDGIAEAYHRAGELPSVPVAAWADVVGRQAVWAARMGRGSEALRLSSQAAALDPSRGRLVAAEVALARRRLADAETLLRDAISANPEDTRTLDDLSTALAEQGRWEEALVTLRRLRARRPSDVRLDLREAEWAHRREPGSDTMAALERVVRVSPLIEGRSAMARAYFRAGASAPLIALLESANDLTDEDRVLLARSLRTTGRPDEASRVLASPVVATLEARLLAAELDAARGDPSAGDAAFAALVRDAEAEPAWYLAWAGTQTRGADVVRVLKGGAARFPDDADLHERLAIAAWSEREESVAEWAADRTIALDGTRAAAWFVKIESSHKRDPGDTLETVLDAFESRFPADAAVRIGMAEMLAGLTRPGDDRLARRALGWMEALLATDPGHITAVVARARLLGALGRTDEALEALDALGTTPSQLPGSLRLRAELLMAAARFGDAVDAFEQYLATAPDDIAARRQQARIDGWRGEYASALRRYERIRQDTPQSRALAEEAEAKRAYFDGRWERALQHYDRWLELEPQEVEAALERAQVLDQLGQPARAAEAYRSVSTRVGPNDVALAAADRVERRRRSSVDLFATSESADATARLQMLRLYDTGAAYADDFGLGYGTRLRFAAGPSWADGATSAWHGHHVSGQAATLLSPAFGVSGSLTVRQLRALDEAWFGDAGLTWRARHNLRLSAGIARTLLLENETTLVDGVSGYGPRLEAEWSFRPDVTVRVAGAQSLQSDGNRRHVARASLSARVLRGASELFLIGTSELIGYAESRETYFTPTSFWRYDAGAEWRGRLGTPRFYGDRERWVSAAYLLGADDRGEVYHTGRVGFSYELSSGVGVVAAGQIVRSRVYDGTSLTIGLRLAPVALPRP